MLALPHLGQQQADQHLNQRRLVGVDGALEHRTGRDPHPPAQGTGGEVDDRIQHRGQRGPAAQARARPADHSHGLHDGVDAFGPGPGIGQHGGHFGQRGSAVIGHHLTGLQIRQCLAGQSNIRQQRGQRIAQLVLDAGGQRSQQGQPMQVL